MRLINRLILGATFCAPALLAFPATASAAGPTDVTYAFEVDGSTVTNTITNNSGQALACATSLAPAPGGVLPPVWDVIGNGQSLYSNDVAGQPGVSSQSISDIPAGSYVALATCGTENTDPMTLWVSDYPGLREALGGLPWTAYTVPQASPIVTISDPAPVLPDLGALPGSGSAG